MGTNREREGEGERERERERDRERSIDLLAEWVCCIDEAMGGTANDHRTYTYSVISGAIYARKVME
jgi:hypothetical protein